MDTDVTQEKLILNKSYVSMDDVRAEAALVELETGKRPSLRIIRMRLQDTDRILYYGDYSNILDVAKAPWSTELPNANIINRIVDWALNQSQDKQEAVFRFLDSENKEEALSLVMKQLGLVEVVEITAQKSKTKPMSQIMRDSLPATKDELTTLIQEISPSTKRPAATVRQFLRSETRRNLIFEGNDGRYHHA